MLETVPNFVNYLSLIGKVRNGYNCGWAYQNYSKMEPSSEQVNLSLRFIKKGEEETTK